MSEDNSPRESWAFNVDFNIDGLDKLKTSSEAAKIYLENLNSTANSAEEAAKILTKTGDALSGKIKESQTVRKSTNTELKKLNASISGTKKVLDTGIKDTFNSSYSTFNTAINTVIKSVKLKIEEAVKNAGIGEVSVQLGTSLEKFNKIAEKVDSSSKKVSKSANKIKKATKKMIAAANSFGDNIKVQVEGRSGAYNGTRNVNKGANTNSSANQGAILISKSMERLQSVINGLEKQGLGLSEGTKTLVENTKKMTDNLVGGGKGTNPSTNKPQKTIPTTGKNNDKPPSNNKESVISGNLNFSKIGRSLQEKANELLKQEALSVISKSSSVDKVNISQTKKIQGGAEGSEGIRKTARQAQIEVLSTMDEAKKLFVATHELVHAQRRAVENPLQEDKKRNKSAQKIAENELVTDLLAFAKTGARTKGTKLSPAAAIQSRLGLNSSDANKFYSAATSRVSNNATAKENEKTILENLSKILKGESVGSLSEAQSKSLSEKISKRMVETGNQTVKVLRETGAGIVGTIKEKLDKVISEIANELGGTTSTTAEGDNKNLSTGNKKSTYATSSERRNKRLAAQQEKASFKATGKEERRNEILNRALQKAQESTGHNLGIKDTNKITDSLVDKGFIDQTTEQGRNAISALGKAFAFLNEKSLEIAGEEDKAFKALRKVFEGILSGKNFTEGQFTGAFSIEGGIGQGQEQIISSADIADSIARKNKNLPKVGEKLTRVTGEFNARDYRGTILETLRKNAPTEEGRRPTSKNKNQKGVSLASIKEEEQKNKKRRNDKSYDGEVPPPPTPEDINKLFSGKILDEVLKDKQVKKAFEKLSEEEQTFARRALIKEIQTMAKRNPNVIAGAPSTVSLRESAANDPSVFRAIVKGDTKAASKGVGAKVSKTDISNTLQLTKRDRSSDPAYVEKFARTNAITDHEELDRNLKAQAAISAFSKLAGTRKKGGASATAFARENVDKLLGNGGTNGGVGVMGNEDDFVSSMLNSGLTRNGKALSETNPEDIKFAKALHTMEEFKNFVVKGKSLIQTIADSRQETKNLSVTPSTGANEENSLSLQEILKNGLEPIPSDVALSENEEGDLLARGLIKRQDIQKLKKTEGGKSSATTLGPIIGTNGEITQPSPAAKVEAQKEPQKTAEELYAEGQKRAKVAKELGFREGSNRRIAGITFKEFKESVGGKDESNLRNRIIKTIDRLLSMQEYRSKNKTRTIPEQKAALYGEKPNPQAEAYNRSQENLENLRGEKPAEGLGETDSAQNRLAKELSTEWLTSAQKELRRDLIKATRSSESAPTGVKSSALRAFHGIANGALQEKYLSNEPGDEVAKEALSITTDEKMKGIRFSNRFQQRAPISSGDLSNVLAAQENKMTTAKGIGLNAKKQKLEGMANKNGDYAIRLKSEITEMEKSIEGIQEIRRILSDSKIVEKIAGIPSISIKAGSNRADAINQVSGAIDSLKQRSALIKQIDLPHSVSKENFTDEQLLGQAKKRGIVIPTSLSNTIRGSGLSIDEEGELEKLKGRKKASGLSKEQKDEDKKRIEEFKQIKRDRKKAARIQLEDLIHTEGKVSEFRQSKLKNVRGTLEKGRGENVTKGLAKKITPDLKSASLIFNPEDVITEAATTSENLNKIFSESGGGGINNFLKGLNVLSKSMEKYRSQIPEFMGNAIKSTDEIIKVYEKITEALAGMKGGKRLSRISAAVTNSLKLIRGDSLGEKEIASIKSLKEGELSQVQPTEEEKGILKTAIQKVEEKKAMSNMRRGVNVLGSGNDLTTRPLVSEIKPNGEPNTIDDVGKAKRERKDRARHLEEYSNSLRRFKGEHEEARKELSTGKKRKKSINRRLKKISSEMPSTESQEKDKKALELGKRLSIEKKNLLKEREEIEKKSITILEEIKKIEEWKKSLTEEIKVLRKQVKQDNLEIARENEIERKKNGTIGNAGETTLGPVISGASGNSAQLDAKIEALKTETENKRRTKEEQQRKRKVLYRDVNGINSNIKEERESLLANDPELKRYERLKRTAQKDSISSSNKITEAKRKESENGPTEERNKEIEKLNNQFKRANGRVVKYTEAIRKRTDKIKNSSSINERIEKLTKERLRKEEVINALTDSIENIKIIEIAYDEQIKKYSVERAAALAAEASAEVATEQAEKTTTPASEKSTANVKSTNTNESIKDKENKRNKAQEKIKNLEEQKNSRKENLIKEDPRIIEARKKGTKALADLENVEENYTKEKERIKKEFGTGDGKTVTKNRGDANKKVREKYEKEKYDLNTKINKYGNIVFERINEIKALMSKDKKILKFNEEIEKETKRIAKLTTEISALKKGELISEEKVLHSSAANKAATENGKPPIAASTIPPPSPKSGNSEGGSQNPPGNPPPPPPPGTPESQPSPEDKHNRNKTNEALRQAESRLIHAQQISNEGGTSTGFAILATALSVISDINAKILIEISPLKEEIRSVSTKVVDEIRKTIPILNAIKSKEFKISEVGRKSKDKNVDVSGSGANVKTAQKKITVPRQLQEMTNELINTPGMDTDGLKKQILGKVGEDINEKQVEESIRRAKNKKARKENEKSRIPREVNSAAKIVYSNKNLSPDEQLSSIQSKTGTTEEVAKKAIERQRLEEEARLVVEERRKRESSERKAANKAQREIERRNKEEEKKKQKISNFEEKKQNIINGTPQTEGMTALTTEEQQLKLAMDRSREVFNRLNIVVRQLTGTMANSNNQEDVSNAQKKLEFLEQQGDLQTRDDFQRVFEDKKNLDFIKSGVDTKLTGSTFVSKIHPGAENRNKGETDLAYSDRLLTILSSITATEKQRKDIEISIGKIFNKQGVSVAKIQEKLTAKEASASLERLRGQVRKIIQLSNGKPLFARVSGKRADFLRTVNAAKSAASAAAEQERRVGSLIKGVSNRVILYGGISFALYGVIQRIREAVGEMIKFQSSIVATTKVMNPLIANIDLIASSAKDLGKEFGFSLVDATEAMTVFAQQGKSSSAIVNLTKASLLAANTTTLDAKSATEALTAALKQFKIEDKKAIEVLDSWNEVENRTAVTSQTLTDAVKQAGTSARLAGITFDELNGIIAGVGAATRQTGNELGRSFRFIISRLRTDDSVEAIQSLGIAMFNTNGQFRDTFPVLQELASRWGTLSDVQKTSVALTIAGARRYNSLLVLMDQWDSVIDNTVNSIDSQNSSLKENERVMGTTEKKVAKLKASVEGLVTGIGNSGGLALIDSLVGKLDGLASFFGSFPDFAKAIGASVAAVVGGISLIAQGVQATGIDNIAYNRELLTNTKKTVKKTLASVKKEVAGSDINILQVSSKQAGEIRRKIMGQMDTIAESSTSELAKRGLINAKEGTDEYKNAVNEQRQAAVKAFKSTDKYLSRIEKFGKGGGAGAKTAAAINRVSDAVAKNRLAFLGAATAVKILAQTATDKFSASGRTITGDLANTAGEAAFNYALIGTTITSSLRESETLSKVIKSTNSSLGKFGKLSTRGVSGLAGIVATAVLSLGALKDLYKNAFGSTENNLKILQLEEERLKTIDKALLTYKRIRKETENIKTASPIDLQNLKEAEDILKRLIPGVTVFTGSSRTGINRKAVDKLLKDENGRSNIARGLREQQASAALFSKPSGFISDRLPNFISKLIGGSSQFEKVNNELIAANDELYKYELKREDVLDRINKKRKDGLEVSNLLKREQQRTNREYNVTSDKIKALQQEEEKLRRPTFRLIAESGTDVLKNIRGLKLTDLIDNKGFSETIKENIRTIAEQEHRSIASVVKEAASSRIQAAFKGLSFNIAPGAEDALDKFGRQFILLEDRTKKAADGFSNYEIQVKKFLRKNGKLGSGKESVLKFRVKAGSNSTQIHSEALKQVQKQLGLDTKGMKDFIFMLDKLSSIEIKIPLGSFKKFQSAANTVFQSVQTNYQVLTETLATPIKIGRLSNTDIKDNLAEARRQMTLTVKEAGNFNYTIGEIPDGFKEYIDKAGDAEVGTRDFGKGLNFLGKIARKNESTFGDLIASSLVYTTAIDSQKGAVLGLASEFFKASKNEGAFGDALENLDGESDGLEKRLISVKNKIDEVFKLSGRSITVDQILRGSNASEEKLRKELSTSLAIIGRNERGNLKKVIKEVIAAASSVYQNYKNLKQQSEAIIPLRVGNALIKEGRVSKDAVQSIQNEISKAQGSIDSYSLDSAKRVNNLSKAIHEATNSAKKSLENYRIEFDKAVNKGNNSEANNYKVKIEEIIKRIKDLKNAEKNMNSVSDSFVRAAKESAVANVSVQNFLNSLNDLVSIKVAGLDVSQFKGFGAGSFKSLVIAQVRAKELAEERRKIIQKINILESKAEVTDDEDKRKRIVKDILSLKKEENIVDNKQRDAANEILKAQKKISEEIKNRIKTQARLNAEFKVAKLLGIDVLGAQKKLAENKISAGVESATRFQVLIDSGAAKGVNESLVKNVERAIKAFGKSAKEVRRESSPGRSKALALASTQEKVIATRIEAELKAGKSINSILSDATIKQIVRSSSFLQGFVDEKLKNEPNIRLAKATETMGEKLKNLADAMDNFTNAVEKLKPKDETIKDQLKAAISPLVTNLGTANRLLGIIIKNGTPRNQGIIVSGSNKNTDINNAPIKTKLYSKGSAAEHPTTDGRIPGNRGQGILAVLHGGERVLSAKEVDTLKSTGIPGFKTGSGRNALVKEDIIKFLTDRGIPKSETKKATKNVLLKKLEELNKEKKIPNLEAVISFREEEARNAGKGILNHKREPIESVLEKINKNKTYDTNSKIIEMIEENRKQKRITKKTNGKNSRFEKTRKETIQQIKDTTKKRKTKNYQKLTESPTNSAAEKVTNKIEKSKSFSKLDIAKKGAIVGLAALDIYSAYNNSFDNLKGLRLAERRLKQLETEKKNGISRPTTDGEIKQVKKRIKNARAGFTKGLGRGAQGIGVILGEIQKTKKISGKLGIFGSALSIGSTLYKDYTNGGMQEGDISSLIGDIINLGYFAANGKKLKEAAKTGETIKNVTSMPMIIKNAISAIKSSGSIFEGAKKIGSFSVPGTAGTSLLGRTGVSLGDAFTTGEGAFRGVNVFAGAEALSSILQLTGKGIQATGAENYGKAFTAASKFISPIENIKSIFKTTGAIPAAFTGGKNETLDTLERFQKETGNTGFFKSAASGLLTSTGVAKNALEKIDNAKKNSNSYDTFRNYVLPGLRKKPSKFTDIKNSLNAVSNIYGNLTGNNQILKDSYNGILKPKELQNYLKRTKQSFSGAMSKLGFSDFLKSITRATDPRATNENRNEAYRKSKSTLREFSEEISKRQAMRKELSEIKKKKRKRLKEKKSKYNKYYAGILEENRERAISNGTIDTSLFHAKLREKDFSNITRANNPKIAVPFLSTELSGSTKERATTLARSFQLFRKNYIKAKNRKNYPILPSDKEFRASSLIAFQEAAKYSHDFMGENNTVFFNKVWKEIMGPKSNIDNIAQSVLDTKFNPSDSWEIFTGELSNFAKKAKIKYEKKKHEKEITEMIPKEMNKQKQKTEREKLNTTTYGVMKDQVETVSKINRRYSKDRYGYFDRYTKERITGKKLDEIKRAKLLRKMIRKSDRGERVFPNNEKQKELLKVAERISEYKNARRFYFGKVIKKNGEWVIKKSGIPLEGEPLKRFKEFLKLHEQGRRDPSWQKFIKLNKLNKNGKEKIIQFSKGSAAKYPTNNGRIPGNRGQGMLAVLHGGERVLSAKEVDNLSRIGIPGFKNGSGKTEAGVSISDFVKASEVELQPAIDEFSVAVSEFRSIINSDNSKNKKTDEQKVSGTIQHEGDVVVTMSDDVTAMFKELRGLIIAANAKSQNLQVGEIINRKTVR